jgi:hypothetical protein
MAGWIWRPHGGGGRRLDDSGLLEGGDDLSLALAMDHGVQNVTDRMCLDTSRFGLGEPGTLV